MALTKTERNQIAWDKINENAETDLFGSKARAITNSDGTAINDSDTIKNPLAELIVADKKPKQKVKEVKQIDTPLQKDTFKLESRNTKATPFSIPEMEQTSFGATGNTIGAVSGAVGNLANLGMVLGSKEKKKNNPFANYAMDTLSTLASIESMAGSIKDSQHAGVTLAKNTARSNNRNSARGVNDLRALDMGTFIGGMIEDRKIDENYQDTMIDVKNKKADVQLKRDSMIMSGQERTNDINQKNKDAYLSEISNVVTDMSNNGKQLGKTINQTESDEIGMKLYGSGKYGNYEDYMSNLGF